MMYDGDVTALEHHEVEQLLDVAGRASFRKELTVRTLLETGLRANELAHIKPHWLLEDREPPAIQVPAHEPCDCSECMGRAEHNLKRWCEAETEDDENRPEVGSDEYHELLEERKNEMWHPKSGSGARKAPVHNEWVWDGLSEHVEEHDGFSAGRTGIWSRVNALDDEMDLQKPLSPHVLRHTFGTEMVRGDIGISELKELMGHASIESTQAYLHPTYSDLADSAKQARENARNE